MIVPWALPTAIQFNRFAVTGFLGKASVCDRLFDFRERELTRLYHAKQNLNRFLSLMFFFS